MWNIENSKNFIFFKRMYTYFSGIIVMDNFKGWSNIGRILGIRLVRKKKIVWILGFF